MLNGAWFKNRFVQTSIMALFFALIGAGCATAGHSFRNEAVSSLELGQLKSSECRATFGTHPSATSQELKDEGKFEVVRYTYASANPGTAQGRTLIVEFKNDTLNAFIYVSSFSDDRTLTSFDKASQIVKHVTTKDGVLNLLGKPCGKALSPCTLNDYKNRFGSGVEIWTWQAVSKIVTMAASYGGRHRPARKSIFVTFDKNGVVAEVLTSESSG